MKRAGRVFEVIKLETDLSDTELLIESLSEIRQAAIKSNEAELIKKIDFDIDLISLCTQTPLVYESEDARFIPRYIFDNGRKYPDIDDFTAEQFEYYDVQLDEQRNIFLKQKYADFMYEYDVKSKKNKKELSEITLNCLLIISNEDELDKSGAFINYIDAMARMTQISMKFKNKKYLEQVIRKILRFLTLALKNNWSMNYVYEISNLFLIIEKKNLIEINDTQKKCLLDILYEFKKNAINIGDFDSDRVLTKIIHDFIKRSPDRDATLLRDLLLQIGHSYKREAFTSISDVNKAYLLDKAVKHYSDYGFTEEIGSTKVEIKHAYKEEEKNLKSLQVELEIPNEIIEQELEPFKDLNIQDSLIKIREDQILKIIPVKEKVKIQLEAIKKEFPLQFMFTTLVLSNGNKIFEDSSEEAVTKMKFNQLYMHSLFGKLNLLLIPLIEKLKSEKGLNWNQLFEEIIQSGIIDENKHVFLKLGISKHFEEDYISAIHILVPQFEDVVRNIFNNLKYPTTSIKKGSTMNEMTFNVFLAQPSVKEKLGVDLHKLIQLTMVEDTGLNLRNKVAHGFINIEECNQTNSTLVLFLYLLLSNLSNVTLVD